MQTIGQPHSETQQALRRVSQSLLRPAYYLLAAVATLATVATRSA